MFGKKKGPELGVQFDEDGRCRLAITRGVKQGKEVSITLALATAVELAQKINQKAVDHSTYTKRRQ